jgi:hypothetical protein
LIKPAAPLTKPAAGIVDTMAASHHDYRLNG